MLSVLDPSKLSIARLKLSLNLDWPDNGCISRGWPKEVFASISERYNDRITTSEYWTLGKPAKFFIRLSNLIDIHEGVASSRAEVYHKESEDIYVNLIDLSLNRKSDILAVVEYLHGMLSDTPEPVYAHASRDWQETMADFDSELSHFTSLPIEKDDWDDCSEEDVDGGMYCKDLPEWLDYIVEEWRYFKPDDYTKFDKLRAFMRMQRAWGSWMGAEGRLYGSIYNEYLKRLDNTIWIVDRKLEKEKNPTAVASFAGLLPLTLPALIEDAVRDKDIQYVKYNCKWAARQLIKKDISITAGDAMLLLDIREENSRIPKEFTAFMQKEIPQLIENETEAITKSNSGSTCLRKANLLAIKSRWSRIQKKLTTSLADEYYGELIQLTEQFKTSPDSESAYVLCRLYTEYLSGTAREKDKEEFIDSVNSIIKDEILNQALSPTEMFNYAASVIEHLYTKAELIEGHSITEHHRLMYEMNQQEKKWEQENRCFDGLPFDFF